MRKFRKKELIAQGILSILNRESPRFLVERLNVQLSPTEKIIDASWYIFFTISHKSKLY